MARTQEFIKKSEARIIMYLFNVANNLKTAIYIGKKLNIDYFYVIKLLHRMYDKGWLSSHLYDKKIFFYTNRRTPITEARQRIINEQSKIGEHDNRQT